MGSFPDSQCLCSLDQPSLFPLLPFLPEEWDSVGNMSGIGGVQSASGMDVGWWSSVRPEDRTSLNTCLRWFHLPPRGLFSLASSSAAHVSSQHRGAAEGTCSHVPPNDSSHQDTLATEPDFHQPCRRKFDLVKFEPSYF